MHLDRTPAPWPRRADVAPHRRAATAPAARRRALWLAGAVLLAAPAMAHADDAAGDTHAPGDIVVTGRGLAPPPADPAYDSQVLSGDRLTATARIEDVLTSVAGFQEFRRSDSTSANPSAQGATLRALGGNAASRTLVTLDGVPMVDPMFGSVPFTALVPGSLSAIRITRGGGSGSAGPGAEAGTIALESAGPDTLSLVSASALADNRGETALTGSLAPHIGNGFAVLSAHWDRGEGFWTTPVAQRVAASTRAAYDSWSVGLRAVAPIAPNIDVQARGLVFNDLRTLRFAGANSQSDGADASLRVIGHGPWQFDLTGWVQERGFSNIVISSSTYKKTLDQRSTPSSGLGTRAEVRPPLGDRHVLRLGADWRTARGDLSEVSYAATGAVTGQRHAGGRNGDTGLFADETWTLTGHGRDAGTVLLTGTARADHWTIDDGYIQTTTAAGVPLTNGAYANRAGWAFTGRGGAVWQIAAPIALRGSAYTGFRQPTLNELYRTYVVFPVTTQANPTLVNEVLTGYEGGLDLTPFKGLTLGATVFDNRVRHAIANVTVGKNLQLRENVAAIHARGVEVSAAWQIGRVSLDGSLAWSDPRVEAPGTTLNGLRPAQTARLAANAALRWRPKLLGSEGWLAAVELHRIGNQFEDDLNASILPAATTLAATFEAPLARGIKLVLRGQNLTDATVETRNQAGSIDLGPPRTVWFGVKAGF